VQEVENCEEIQITLTGDLIVEQARKAFRTVYPEVPALKTPEFSIGWLS